MPTTATPGIWLVLAKKVRGATTGPTTITYEQALEEAVCYGWVDGQVGRRDELTYRQRFTPRGGTKAPGRQTMWHSQGGS